MNELLEQYKEERRSSRLVKLPIDYEKEYITATDKLHYHTSQHNYHATMQKYYEEQVEELLPLTNVEERKLAKIEKEKQARENSPEYIEMKKKIKKEANRLLVLRMLRQTGVEI
jgi:UDP-N-acetylmuramoylalanine-D-glutamate ligase